MRKKITVLAALASLTAGLAVAQTTRDYISIVGSSTVYPFSTVVAERFGRSTRFKTPKIEATGSGGGIKLFCAGVGVQYPDISNSSRRIKQSEVDECAKNQVTEIVEVRIGYDGIVVANSADAGRYELTLRDLWLALAKEVPAKDGAAKLVANPYRNWQDIDPRLPDAGIEVYGPPPTSGTRDAFVELAMEGGCQTFDWIKALKASDKTRYEQICHTLREDALFIEAGENDNLIVQKLAANPRALGIFGFSFLDQNTDTVQGASIDGVSPSFESIADGEYVISRPLFFYVKKAHVGRIPGIEEFVREFTSERAWGEDGYLSERGLIPLPDGEKQQQAARAKALEPLRLSAR